MTPINRLRTIGGVDTGLEGFIYYSLGHIRSTLWAIRQVSQ